MAIAEGQHPLPIQITVDEAVPLRLLLEDPGNMFSAKSVTQTDVVVVLTTLDGSPRVLRGTPLAGQGVLFSAMVPPSERLYVFVKSARFRLRKKGGVKELPDRGESFAIASARNLADSYALTFLVTGQR